MRRHSPVLLLALTLCLVAVSCSSAELPPLEGEPAELAEKFIGSLVEGDYDGCVGYFNAKMKRAMSARKLEKVWTDLQAQVGPYVGEAGMREEVIDGYDVVFVTTEFEEDLINIRVVFGEDRRVAGLWFEPVH
jgi:hypothetical protein